MTATFMPTPSERTPPWYREPWPWLLMAGPAIVVVAAFVTLYLAIASDDGVVADDYYRQGLVINRVLAREQRGVALGIGAVVTIDDDGAVRVDIGPAGDAAPPEAMTLKLSHATRAGMDRGVTLRRGADGAYFGRVAPPPAGRWLVMLQTEDWRLPTVEVEGRPQLIRMGTAAAAP
jgi:hypothetical protein